MGAVDKDALFAPRLPTADVEVPGVGTVTIRALSRAEVMRARSDVKSIEDAIKRQAELERRMLASAMVAPELTAEEVRRWQRASPAGEIEVVTDAVERLSGLKDGEAREVYREMEADPAVEFRVPPGE